MLGRKNNILNQSPIPPNDEHNLDNMAGRENVDGKEYDAEGMNKLWVAQDAEEEELLNLLEE